MKPLLGERPANAPDRLLVVVMGAAVAVASLWLGLTSDTPEYFALAGSFTLFTVFWYFWLPAGIFHRRKGEKPPRFRAITGFERGVLTFGLVLLFMSIGAQLLGG